MCTQNKIFKVRKESVVAHLSFFFSSFFFFFLSFLIFIYLFIFFCGFSETGFLCISLVVLELTLSLNSEIHLPLPSRLPSAGIKGVRHHAQRVSG
jgi:hypothetical protein